MRLGVAFLLSLLATPAVAGPCAQTVVMYEHLRTTYRETPAFVAANAGGGVLVVMLSDKGTYTLVIQPSAEISCAVGAGDSWAPAPDTMRHPLKPETKS